MIYTSNLEAAAMLVKLALENFCQHFILSKRL
jgi:hypothetical protein